MNILLVNTISNNKSKIGGVQYHRMVKPNTVLRRLRPEYDYVMCNGIVDESGDCHPDLKQIIEQTDLVIFSRIIRDEDAEYLNKIGLKFGLDLDDHWILPSHHILYNAYKEFNTTQRTINSIRCAHFCIVTTPYLADEVKQINENVFIIENGIDEDDEIWRPNKNPSDRLRFGFTQGNTHLEDIKTISASVRKSYSDIQFFKKAQVVLTGYYQANPKHITAECIYEKELTDDLKVLRMYQDYVHELRILHDSKYINLPYRRIWGKEVTEFASVYNDIDISVVPLIANKFNSCKSELKMLEAGFKDCAVMVSHVKPYDLLATDKNSFNLSKHTFFELQRIILNNPNLVNDKKAQLREDVQKYSLNVLSEKRHQLYQQYKK